MQCRRPVFDPWVGKNPGRREWLPTPAFLPEEFHGQRSLAGYIQSMESQRIGYYWATNIFTFGRKNRIHISLQYPRTNTKLDHIYSHKINISNLKELKSQNILNNHNGIKLETNNRKRIESEKSWELTTYFKKTNKIHGLKRKTQEKIHCIKWKLKYDT